MKTYLISTFLLLLQKFSDPYNEINVQIKLTILRLEIEENAATFCMQCVGMLQKSSSGIAMKMKFFLEELIKDEYLPPFAFIHHKILLS